MFLEDKINWFLEKARVNSHDKNKEKVRNVN